MGLALTCLQRAFTYFPILTSAPLDTIPGPLILTENNSAIWFGFWALVWAVVGIMLFLAPFIGSKVVIFSTPETQFRLDDLALTTLCAMFLTWGLSYYFSWMASLWDNIPGFSNAYLSGGNYLGPGLFIFAVWAIWFSTRNERGDVTQTLDKPDSLPHSFEKVPPQSPE